MALPIECVTVVVRKDAVESRFPGGLDGFASQEVPNLAEDDQLMSVSFMSGRDAFAFVSELEAAGLRYLETDPETDVAVVAGSDCPMPSWLSYCPVEGGGVALYATGHPPGELANLEHSIILRCARAVYDSLPQAVRECHAELARTATRAEREFVAAWRCTRGEAEIVIEAIGDGKDGMLMGLWGRRDLARRNQRHEDAALLRDLSAALVRAGATE